jgi:hypothetical protein
MVNTYVRMVAFHYAVLRGAISTWRDEDEGMTTLEVLIIAAGLIALGIGAVALIGDTASGAIGHGKTPTAAIS